MKKLLLIVIALAQGCVAALTPGALQVRGASFSTTNTMTWTGPAVTGANTTGLLHCGWISASSITANTPTWGTGVNMTAVPGASVSNTTNGVAVFYIFAPASAASITFSTSGNWASVFCDATYFTGSNQSTAPHNGGVFTGTSSSGFSGSGVTTLPGEYVVDTTLQLLTSATLSATTPSVKTSSGNSGTGPISWGASYQGPIASAGTTTMAWTSTSSGIWVEASISIAPAIGGNAMLTLGVGK